MAVDFDPLAVQAGPCPVGDFIRDSLPDIPGGDEVAGSSHTWVCRTMWVVKNLSGRSLGTRGRDVPVAALPKAQLLAGEEVLFLSADDLTEGHALKVKGAQQEAAPVRAVLEVGRAVHLSQR